MRIDDDAAAALRDTKVVEFATITRSEGLNTRPMSASWLPDNEQIVLTTPPAYAQKVLNARRDVRVALLYSDFTGSGLAPEQSFLVQGVAHAPDVVAGPQQLEAYWRELLRKNPALLDETLDPSYRQAMDWYYWRLPISVTPVHIHRLPSTPTGGAWDGHLSPGSDLREQLDEALERYPSAVLAARDSNGHPTLARAIPARRDATTLSVSTPEPFPGTPGSANLLWHRHNGRSAEMSELLVDGHVSGSGTTWTFTPERLPAASVAAPASFEEWVADARTRSLDYLSRNSLAAPDVDWDFLASLTDRSDSSSNRPSS